MKTRYEKALEMSDKEFRRLFGFTKNSITIMVEILWEAYAAKHKRRGRHSKLDVADMLLLACKYWSEYVTLNINRSVGIPEKRGIRPLKRRLPFVQKHE